MCKKLLLIVLAIVTILIFATVGPAHADGERGRPLMMQRIQADYVARRLTIDQYILYKAWAVFQPDKLSGTKYALSPEEEWAYKKHGTMIILEIKGKWDRLSPETREQLGFVFLRPTDIRGGIDNLRHKLPQLYTSPGGNFVMHWTDGTDGGSSGDAPPLLDSDDDGTPDYVEDFATIFDNVWNFEVNTRGFQAPPSDAAESDDGNNRNPNEKYDIFIYDMNAYGYADPEQHPNSPSYSYIGVDNDYAGFLGTQLGCMQVTAAHEFFHAIQFYYDCTEESWWMETTSTYMEDEVYPDVNDNYQYLPFWFEWSDTYGLTSTYSLHEYGNFIWAKRLSEDFGDGIIKDIWVENQTTDGLTSIDNVLGTEGSSLTAEFNKFTRSNFFLEDMYIDGADYRSTVTGETTYDGVWTEYQYNEATDGLPFVIDNTNVSWDAWMDTWAADYITIQMSGATPRYTITFDGLDATTNYDVSLATKTAGDITSQDFTLDADKDGSVILPYDSAYTDIVLIIRNSGDNDTADPSYTVSIRATPTITSCDLAGSEKNYFTPGESVYVKGSGLFSPDTDYSIWIQLDPVNEGDGLVAGEDPSGSQETVTTDGNGDFPTTLIWSIPSDAPITHTEYDIVINKLGDSTYKAADDGLDDAIVAGITAPIPEASTLVLLTTGILCLFGILYLRRRREKLM